MLDQEVATDSNGEFIIITSIKHCWLFSQIKIIDFLTQGTAMAQKG